MTGNKKSQRGVKPLHQEPMEVVGVRVPGWLATWLRSRGKTASGAARDILVNAAENDARTAPTVADPNQPTTRGDRP